MKTRNLLLVLLGLSMGPAFAIDIATVNLAGSMESQKLAHFLSHHNADDVIFLQEVLRPTWKKPVSEEISKNLKTFGREYRSFFAERQNRLLERNEGLGILLPKRFEVISVESKNIRAIPSPSEQRKHMFFWRRNVLSLQVQDPEWGVVRFVNLHLAHHKSFFKCRQLQLKEVLNWLAQLEFDSPSRVVVLGGDFNTGFHEDFYQGELDFLFSDKNPLKMSFQNFNGKQPSWNKERLDHIFVASRKEKISLMQELVSPLQWKATSLSDHFMLRHRYHKAQLIELAKQNQ